MFPACRPLPILLTLGLLIGSTAWFGTARGDAVQLRGGGRIEGTVARGESGKVPYVLVAVDPRLKVAIPENQVSRVAESELLDEYRERVAATPATAEAQYDLGLWCQRSILLPQSKHHFQRAVRIDPNHSRARSALGYVAHDGGWVRYSDLQESRGMVKIGGKYRVPAEWMISQAQAEADKAAKLWVRELDRLKKSIARGGDRAAEAWATLAAIDDPLAALSIGKELTEVPGQARDLRIFWIEKLAQLNSPAGLGPLLRVGLSESDPVVREKALETLNQFAPTAAKVFYVQRLKDKDNAVIRRAAEALTFFPDPELALPLINALVSTHKTVIPADQSTNVAFNSAGAGGLTTGGKAMTRVDRVENPPVLAALRAIEPDVNYGFNQRMWRQHLAAKLSGYRGDMRRDE